MNVTISTPDQNQLPALVPSTVNVIGRFPLDFDPYHAQTLVRLKHLFPSTCFIRDAGSFRDLAVELALSNWMAKEITRKL